MCACIITMVGSKKYFVFEKSHRRTDKANMDNLFTPRTVSICVARVKRFRQRHESVKEIVEAGQVYAGI